jgi:hypothetical protein
METSCAGLEMLGFDLSDRIIRQVLPWKEFRGMSQILDILYGGAKDPDKGVF